MRIRTVAATLVLTLAPLAVIADSATAGVQTGFEDVADDSTFTISISWLRMTGITRGCNPPANTAFCPETPVTRDQMAAFLSRALNLEPATVADRFSDDDSSPFEGDIDRLAAAGITAGCNPPANDRFCPDSHVTRGQMAAFLARSYDLPAVAGVRQFSDLGSSVFADDIARVATAGITAGCNPPANDRYCPTDVVTREQMAAFIWRANNRPQPGVPARIVAAGDIARCDYDKDEQTAVLLDELFRDTNGAIAALGDTVYNDGSAQQYSECYEPSWGRHRFRTFPAVGNHEYRTTDASGYFDYFGSVAGDPQTGWYTYTLAGWHVIVLNSNCDEISGCDAGDPQELWLRDQLANSDAACTLAYMHHPRFSSGVHGDDDSLTDLWRAFDDYGVDVVLAGHDHNYERLAPLTPDGELAPADGIQSFVVGTGGTWLRPTDTPRLGSEVLVDERHGVLVLDLTPSAYQWQFLDTSGAIADQGTRNCS